MVDVRVQSDARFNVLLTADRERSVEHWTRQLPRLLEPQGVQAFVARTGGEAVELVGRLTIHAAVIDLLTPPGSEPRRVVAESGSDAASDDVPRGSGGLWMLEVLRRLPRRPPVVVINSVGFSQRDGQRLLNEALRLGAFSVINPPVELELLLNVIRRLVDRRYAGHWPSETPETQ